VRIESGLRNVAGDVRWFTETIHLALGGCGSDKHMIVIHLLFGVRKLSSGLILLTMVKHEASLSIYTHAPCNSP
jgi:hypothetical protein